MTAADQTAPAGIPPAEVVIDEPLIRGLLRAQHPDLADLPLQLAATGWDNATYRLGADLAIRLPRIAAAAELIEREQRWLPVIAGWISAGEGWGEREREREGKSGGEGGGLIAVPVPVRIGHPGPGFDWPWSIVQWIPGRSAEHEPLDPGQAPAVGRFLAALHRPAPSGYPRNTYRGVPLAQVAESVDPWLDRLEETETSSGIRFDAVRRRWRAALAAPLDTPPVCLHGDLHPKNLVVDRGVLTAVLDWGDLTAGDPAADLATAWLLFPVEAHDGFWRSYRPISPATMARCLGWAVFFGVTLLRVGLVNDPPFAAIGRETLRRIGATAT